MHTNLRVQIVPFWREHDRVVEPIRQFRPDVVYLLVHDDPSVPRPDYHTDVIEDITSTIGHDPNLVEVDLFDMYDVMGAITTIADTHAAKDHVRVNVNAGTKRAAIGATMACMDDGTDAEPFVVDPQERDYGLETPTTNGFEDCRSLTIYNIDSPSRDQVAILAIIEANHTGAKRAKKKTLLQAAAEHNLEFLQDRLSDADTYTPETGDYNRLDRKIIDELEHRDYITITAEGTRRYLELTDSGRETLRAFRHRAEDIISALETESRTSPNLDFELDNPVDGMHPEEAD